MDIRTVIIVGSGFSGIVAAINLKKQGIDDFVLLERRAFVGGTWAQNTYPGAAVDVQSPLYCIEDNPYDWSQMFATGDELQRYTNHVIDSHGLREKTLTEHTVEKLEWNDAERCWLIHVAGKAPMAARFVINASGALSNPAIPGFEGRDSFAGAAFHTNAWDHGCDLRGKRVAVVGSGASAAQVIPAIAPEVAKLHVFQRTAHWVIARPDYTFRPWQRRAMRRPFLNKLMRKLIYLQLEFRLIGLKYSSPLLFLFGERMARGHLRKQVSDPELRRRLTPDFAFGCKRIILSNALYPTFSRPNVVLHDKTDAIARINPAGIETTQGAQVDLDVIVYATGYDATDGMIAYPVIGRDGLALSQFWADFPRAYLGTTLPGFPNLFIMNGPNTGIGHTSAIYVIEAQMPYVMSSIKAVLEQDRHTIEPRPEVEERYTTGLHTEMKKMIWDKGGCNSWYKGKSGKVISLFPGFSFSFRRLTSRFRPGDHRFG